MNFGETIPFGQALVIYVLTIWILIWKGIALWRAAKYGQRNWFIVMLVIYNTIGILEIVYLFRFAKKRMTIAEIKNWFQKTFTHRPR
jgi:hypothetical protein